MLFHCWLPLAMAAAHLSAPVPNVLACCPAPPSGRPVVNADQTVVIVWDAATQTEHFIRRASFKAEADDFGFLIPTPNRPELSESGDGVFSVLAAVTAPREIAAARSGGGGGCGCAKDAVPATGSAAKPVTVLEEADVAGFHAVVLEARSSEDLVEWLKAGGYAFSPEVQAWAKPYVGQGWKITALKVAKAKPGDPPSTAPGTPAPAGRDVSAAALRLSFKTDRPLFPYREPDPTGPAQTLGVGRRLLRIYFIAEARYQGELTPVEPWTGRPAWAGKLSAADRERALAQLKLPDAGGPAEWWLTEFEDNWPYRPAPADVYFSRSADQSTLERPPIVRYASAGPATLAAAAPAVLVIAGIGVPALFRRLIGRRVG